MLRGAQASAREMGAGSEILGFYDQQIAALEAQQEATEKQVGPINEAQKAPRGSGASSYSDGLGRFA